jgi:hypothetical protein
MANDNDIIQNKVTGSSLALIDLETFYPEIEIAGFDIKPYLFREMILKEKDFREALKNTDWKKFENKAVYIHCSIDTVIPFWAYMLVARYLTPVTNTYIFGSYEQLTEKLIIENIQKTDFSIYKGKKMLIKGCSNSEKIIPASIYVEISRILLPLADSLMYGEACSNVPIFKLGKKL